MMTTLKVFVLFLALAAPAVLSADATAAEQAIIKSMSQAEVTAVLTEAAHEWITHLDILQQEYNDADLTITEVGHLTYDVQSVTFGGVLVALEEGAF